jgi:hypothetical protein
MTWETPSSQYAFSGLFKMKTDTEMEGKQVTILTFYTANPCGGSSFCDWTSNSDCGGHFEAGMLYQSLMPVSRVKNLGN